MLGHNKNILRHFQLLLGLFAVVILAGGIIAYSLAAGQLKNQLALKCQALAATVATVIAEDSEGYAAFLQNMDTQSDYYRRTKALLMQIKNVNKQHVQYLYTTSRAGEDAIMYVLGGENPSSPVYTAPGVQDTITPAERIAYNTLAPTIGEAFERTAYGQRLSAYQPILHKDTGQLLGMAGADITSEQYKSIMQIFIIQTVVSIGAGLLVFTLATHWFSGKVNLIVDRQLFAAQRAEQKLAQENTTLERINRMKTELMATISHEARTPLAVLASYAGLVSMSLKRKGTDAATAADLDKIVAEAQRVADLIDSMQKMTLHGNSMASRIPLDCAELIQQVARLYCPLLHREGVALHLRLNEELWVCANPEELTQVVFNLMQNAKNHTEQGHITIQAARKNGIITVTIADTGSGIAPDLLPHIFERGVKDALGGAGLGLAICKEIVEAHGGTIHIASRKGTTVTVTLPENTNLGALPQTPQRD
ncbi:sensor histidine kinase [Desulfovibrio cuneatus]|uniref:sensor histidine kinase n=1 Tax=Desulfovibrio cuneatus TaxID=159728 RepID=UPI00041E2622|nr:HAMP domain-containing sensor histidine kinase [Desulfovibrio cuneatus]